MRGNPVACVKDIQPGDDLVLGYRGGAVRILARFRVGQPDTPINASQAFGQIPAVWAMSFDGAAIVPTQSLVTLSASSSRRVNRLRAN